MRILGVSAFYHDSAAALLENGEIVAAAQEERFTRKKHDPSFPINAIEFCLKAAGCSLTDVDRIAFYEQSHLKRDRLLKTYLAHAPKGFDSFRRAASVWIGGQRDYPRRIPTELRQLQAPWKTRQKLDFPEHHVSHAASAFYPSPFDNAAILCVDGVGEWATTSLYVGQGTDIKPLKEIRFPHSLGLLYAAFTQYIGFKVNSGEYKMMGLAPYGTPRFAQIIKDNLINIKDDGSFKLNMAYFDYCTGFNMINEAFCSLFGGPRRRPETQITQRDMDIAASIQEVTEEVMLKLARDARRETGLPNLCLAGGVALNCVANGKILRDGAFDQIWIQPAAGDAGGALGAAYYAHFKHSPKQRVPDAGKDQMQGAYLGPGFSDIEIEARLTAVGARFTRYNEEELLSRTIDALENEFAVGWFQGRMEFGPRALGNRSILADPRSPRMQKTLNQRVKFRESFRPFAPSVLAEHAQDCFETDRSSPYMLIVSQVAESQRVPQDVLAGNEPSGLDKLGVVRSRLPAVTHVDYSARVHTVDPETNARYHRLLSKFYERTGCPVLVNTSFNLRGEPIVCTPEDAFKCFMGTGIERLVIGSFMLLKEGQDPALFSDYRDAFELD